MVSANLFRPAILAGDACFYEDRMTVSEWTQPEHVASYLARKDTFPHRGAGEETFLAEIPKNAKRVLDLGCGDGHLLRLVLVHCPHATGVGLDFSPEMLSRAEQNFAGDPRVDFVTHNLDHPLPELGTFDCIVSSVAIHHCSDQRKRAIYAEAFDQLAPGGLFGNMEHVSSPTAAVHNRFLQALELEPGDEDPSNQLLDVESQLAWLRDIGYEDVDCYWKWREIALLIGFKPQCVS